MTVLSILGFSVVIFMVYAYVEYINKISIDRYRYEFFTYANLFVTTIAYAAILFGNHFYTQAIAEHGDKLNGQLLIAIGVMMIIFLLYTHIKKTSLGFGIFYGVIQLLIYLPAGFLSFIAGMIFIAWAMDTRPYYRW